MNIPVPKKEIDSRLDMLRQRLEGAGLDGCLLVSAIDVFYFSGTRQNSILWVPRDSAPVLLVRKSYRRAILESAIGDIRPFPPSRDLPAVFGEGAKTIGLTFDVLPVQHLNFYQGLLKGREFRDISQVNRELRSVKSAWELDQMRQCGSLLSEAFRTIPEYLRPGLRELDLAAEFEYRLRKAGIGGYLRIRGFNQEITGLAVSGASAAEAGCFDGPVTGKGYWTSAPYGPSEAVIPANAPVMVDYGGFYNGYIVDMTRIFCIGSLAPELEHAFRVSLAIQELLREKLVPGAVCEDLYREAYGMASDAGFVDYLMGPPGDQAKFVGHGVGLELDELPVLAPKFTALLAAGQTVAVEPKFIFPGKGAVGIENTFAVTDRGGEKLTPLPDDIVYL